MVLTRKQINNIIILSSAIMISILTLLDKKMSAVPSNAVPLFGIEFPLTQLKFNDHWMHKKPSKWQCHTQVLNCKQWVQAWQNVKISPLETQPKTALIFDNLLLQVEQIPTAQVWQFFSQEGYLKSPANNWYEVPPSLRENLTPIISAN